MMSSFMAAHLTTHEAPRAPGGGIEATPSMEALLMTILSASSPVSDVEFLHEYAETRRYLSGRPVSVKVTPDGKSALFLRSEAKSAAQMLFELDLTTRATKVLLT